MLDAELIEENGLIAFLTNFCGQEPRMGGTKNYVLAPDMAAVVLLKAESGIPILGD